MVKLQRLESDASTISISSPPKKRIKYIPGKCSICLFIAVIILLALATVFLVLFIDGHKKLEVTILTKDEQKIKPESVQVAAEIISSMDTTIDPCTDFYQYACGGWLNKTMISEEDQTVTTILERQRRIEAVLNEILKSLKGKNETSILLRKASTFYETCMDTDQIKTVGDAPLKELVKKLGSWPVTDPNFNGREWKSIQVLAAYRKATNRGLLFDVSVIPDLKNSSVNIITFEKKSHNNLLEEEIVSSPQKRRMVWLKFFQDIAEEMGQINSTFHYIERAYDIYNDLSRYRILAKSKYEKMSLKEFSWNTKIPINWLLSFLNILLEDTGYVVDKTEIIVSLDTAYIKKAYEVFAGLTPEFQSSYTIFNVLSHMSQYLSGNYEQLLYKTTSELSGKRIVPPARWRTCVRTTLIVYGFVLSNPYVEKYFDESAKTEISEMIHGIKNAFTQNLKSKYWIDKQTKHYAKEKVLKMALTIGYPDYIFNNTKMEKLYGGYEPISGHYLENIFEIPKFHSKANFAQIGKQVDKTLWQFAPYTVNAFYFPRNNSINILAGIANFPFYDKRAPKAVQYGSIGTVVGHEVTHGFDSAGIDFTIEGDYNPWWKNESLVEFTERSRCFTKQYNNYRFFHKRVNGKITLRENLADNGGLKQSFEAYKNWVAANGKEKQLPGIDLTPEQMFFVAFGQTWCGKYTKLGADQAVRRQHAPNEIRVKGTIQNSREFSTVFNCPSRSPMNPFHKCQLW